MKNKYKVMLKGLPKKNILGFVFLLLIIIFLLFNIGYGLFTGDIIVFDRFNYGWVHYSGNFIAFYVALLFNIFFVWLVGFIIIRLYRHEI